MKISFLLSVIALSFSFCHLAKAQSPGGVTSREVWFRAVPATSNLQGYYLWKDFSGDSVRNLLYDSRGAAYGTEFRQQRDNITTFNFHPALDLSERTVPKEALLRYSNLYQATVIGIFAPKASSYNSDAVLYHIDGRSGTGSLLSKDKIVRGAGTEPLDYGKDSGEDLLYTESDSLDADGFRESSPRIVSYLKADAPSHTIWGESSRSVITTGYSYSTDNLNGNTTFSGSFGNKTFEGYIPELIAYGRMLTPLERRKVESYLALRYGITLKNSYLDSSGNLVWDMTSEQSYHHRVTGIIRDDAGSLYQPLSTTSYEETPYYTTNSENDTYYNKNSYNLPTSNRLLVMGREYASALRDGDYLLWGDDGGDIATYQPSEDSPWHIMTRKWTVRTNMDSIPEMQQVWNTSGLAIERAGFTYRISQDNTSASAYAVTRFSDSQEAYMEFTLPASAPAFDAGLNGDGTGSCTYGYRFQNGRVYRIVNGKAESGSVAVVQTGRIAISRTGGSLLLRINGMGSAETAIHIPDSLAVSLAHAVIAVQGNDATLSLTDLRLGGFGDTGNQAELGYLLTRDKEFAPYRRKRTLMLIDRSGEGDISPETSLTVRCSDSDATRGKTIFHNLFWDTDKSGSDVFTFAYYDGILADITPFPSTCEDGRAQKDGHIAVHVTIGTPPYRYTLAADSVKGLTSDSLVSAGIFSTDTLTLHSLPAGTYRLELTQSGGMTISTSGNARGGYAFSTHAYANPEFSWSTGDNTSSYHAGLATGTVLGTIISYGFSVDGTTASVIDHGLLLRRTAFQVSEGDVLTLKVNGWMLEYRVNGNMVYRTRVPVRFWTLGAVFGEGVSSLSGVTVNGAVVPFGYTSSEVTAEQSKTRSFVRTVMVGNECDATLPNGVVEAKPSGKAGPAATTTTSIERTETATQTAFMVTASGDSRHTLTATLRLKDSRPATLLIYDTAGKLVGEHPFNGGPQRSLSFSVGQSGVYIIKAITDSDEFTKKTIVR